MARKLTLLIVSFLFVATGCSSLSKYEFGDLSSVPHSQQASLHAPEELQVLTVNGKNLPELYSYLGSQAIHLQLAPGDYELRVRYRDIWDVSDDEHDVLQSKSKLISFLAEEGTTYKLSRPEIKDLKSARSFVENPIIEVVNSKSHASVSQVVATSKFAGVAPSPLKKIEASDAQANIAGVKKNGMKQNSAEEKLQRSKLKEELEAVVDTSKAPKVKSDSLNSMIKNWENASPKERAEFQRWIWKDKN